MLNCFYQTLFKNVYELLPVASICTYDLKIKNILQIPKVKTSFMDKAPYHLEVVYFGTLSDSIKSAQNTKEFKTMIKNWKGESCLSTICKQEIKNCT